MGSSATFGRQSLHAVQARLLQMYDATDDWRQQRLSEQLVLAINRSDYMLDEPSSTLMQVDTFFLKAGLSCDTPVTLQ